MRLSEFSVRRPVTITMIFIGIALLGVISLIRLPQELFPSIVYPRLTVVTTYANAAPEEVETLITKIIEEAISTVRNLKGIHSSSREGISMVTAEFVWGANMDFAALAMREKIDLVKERLPRDAEEPLVKKFNPYAKPIIILSVTGEYSSDELLKITRKFIKDKIEKLEGVASVTISGGREREILVDVDMSNLHGVQVDLLHISKALKESNLNYPAGTTKEKFYEYLIRTIGEFKAVNEIGDTVIGIDEQRSTFGGDEMSAEERKEQQEGEYKRLILLKDVAEIKDTFKELTSFSRFNGKPNISIAIQKQSAANSIQTADRVKKELINLQESLPKGVSVTMTYDESIFIKDAIKGVYEAGYQGMLLAFLVLFFFLKSIKSSIIISLSIPTSILFTFTLMYFRGLTLNLMSLGGLALGIGMLVDNAIVVLENIIRRRQALKEDMVTAAVNGTNEVSGPITSSTLTSIAVFLPMIFLAGVEGQIFKQLAFTVTFALLASLVVALTLIPRMAIVGKRPPGNRYAIQEWIDKFQEWYTSLYSGFLTTVLKAKTFFLFIVILLFFGSILLMGTLEQEFIPKVDQGQFFVEIKLPTGTRVEITNDITKKIEKVLQQIPDVENISTNVGSDKERLAESAESLGSHQARIVVDLKKDRERITDENVQIVKEKLDKVNLLGADITYLVGGGVFGGGAEASADIIIEILGHDLDELQRLTDDVQNKLNSTKGVFNVKNSISAPFPETKVIINKDRASLYGLSTNDVALTCQIAIKGIIATKLKEAGTEIPIKVRLKKSDTDTPDLIKSLYIHSPQGVEISLKEVASIPPSGKGPSEIKRLDRRRVVFVMANINKEATSANAVEESLKAYFENVELPEDYTMKLGGQSAERKEAFKSLMFALILAILMVYMIMAAQFESLLQPFLIMFTVPLSIIGVAIALFITHTPISVVAMLGVIMLGGMVVNNAIILIEYINDLRAEGVGIYDSVVRASTIRLRPIIMTTLTTILGLFPLAIATGEGSELRAPLAIAVMGGLAVSTLLTLLVIPCIYLMTEGLLEKLHNWKNK